MKVKSKTALMALGLVLLVDKLWPRRAEELADQVVLITGGLRGSGFLLAREFATVGGRVIICSRDQAELDYARADLAPQGLTYLPPPATCVIKCRCNS